MKTLLTIAFTLSLASQAHAQGMLVNNPVNYDSQCTDPSGNPLTGGSGCQGPGIPFGNTKPTTCQNGICVVQSPEMSAPLAVGFIVAAGGVAYWLRNRKRDEAVNV